MAEVEVVVVLADVVEVTEEAAEDLEEDHLVVDMGALEGGAVEDMEALEGGAVEGMEALEVGVV